jgi:hypothetical protein
MAEYQVTYWRELPSLVVARDGADESKLPLPMRFQEAIDEAAMRLGETSSDDYLAGWRRGPWSQREGGPVELAAAVAAELEERWPPAAVTAFLDALGPPSAE